MAGNDGLFPCFGAASSESPPSSLSILQTAILANSHSVVASNGRNDVVDWIHPISRALAIYHIYEVLSFPSTSENPLGFEDGSIPRAWRARRIAFARIITQRFTFQRPLATSHRLRAIDSISQETVELEVQPFGHPHIPTPIRRASRREIFVELA